MTVRREHLFASPEQPAANWPIPPDTSLYLAGGVPQMFRHVAGEAPLPDSTWLYLPYQILTKLSHQAIRTSETEPAARLLPALTTEDDIRIFPIAVGETISAVLVTSAESGDIDKDSITKLTNSLTREALEQLQDTAAFTRDEVTKLFTPAATSDQFIRRLLDLLTKQVPDGLAAVYDLTDGIYRLRTAVGNIAMWDILSGTLTNETTSKWLSAIERKNNFVPAGFLPEHPTFLADPPKFLFLSTGLRTDRGGELLAMPIPGEIGNQIGRYLIAITRFVARLHEDNFGTVDVVLSLSSVIKEAAAKHMPFDHVLSTVFKILSKRISLSRLIFVDPDGHASTIVNRAHAEPTVRKELPHNLARVVADNARGGRFLVTDVAAPDLLTEDEAKRYYLDNVKSEYCFAADKADNSDAFVAFGSPDDFSVLKRHERVLETTAGLLWLYRYIAQMETSRETNPVGVSRSRRIAERLTTAARLADGYFHTVFESLSYVLGDAELSRAAAELHDSSAELQRRSSTEHIEAIERAVKSLEEVRQLLMNSTEGHQEQIRLSRLVANLPTVFAGHVHRVQDTKHIAVTIDVRASETAARTIRLSDAYDYLYPAIMAVMDEAICSGQITVQVVAVNGQPAIQIECPTAMIEHALLTDILRSVAGLEPSSEPVIGQTELAMGAYRWVCGCEEKAVQRAWLVPAGTITPPSEKHSSPKLRHDSEST